jgi:hypothetical protein
MNVWIRNLFLGVVLAIPLSIAGTSSVKADDYWDGYWSWYDNTYRPYYYRQYRSPDMYYDGRYYDGRYYYPQTRYYGTPRFGYRENYPGRGEVRVGPLRFGWW